MSNENTKSIKGYVHSFQSLGAVDGPGIRFTVFLSGCNLRCSCCHNPDTWHMNTGKEYTAEEVVNMALRYREYFGEHGGITLTGGEPILQAKFAKEIFTLCKNEGINTCLDTSGSMLNDDIKELLSVTDRVLLDIKFSDDTLYKKHVGCSINEPLLFLDYLNEQGIKTTLRQVIIPGLNDNKMSIYNLRGIKCAYGCVDSAELLPFRKICAVKYNKLGIPFPLADTPEPSLGQMELLNKWLTEFLPD